VILLVVVFPLLSYLIYRWQLHLSYNSKGDKEESKEPDYDEDKDQLDENETGKVVITTNTVF
jgi:hypothetical protein